MSGRLRFCAVNIEPSGWAASSQRRRGDGWPESESADQRPTPETSPAPLARPCQTGYVGLPGLMAHATPNDQTWLSPGFSRSFARPAEAGGGSAGRTEGEPSGLCPANVLSETAGAQEAFGRMRLIPVTPSRGGASIDGDDRVSPAELGFGGECGSNLLSGAGLAQIRGQAQVAAALAQMAAGCGMCNRRIFLRRNSPTGVSKTRG